MVQRALATLAALLDATPRAVAALAAAGWMAFLWWLSSGPVGLPSGWLWALATNFAHGPFFGFLAVLAARTAGLRSARPHAPSLAIGWAVALAWGVTDEWHQARVPGRTASPLDLVTDAAGAFAALWLLARSRDGDEAAARRRFALGAVAVGLAASVATYCG